MFIKVTHLIQAHENTKVQQNPCACISNNRRKKQHQYDISVIILWALPASEERGRDCQYVSSCPESSAVHPAEIRELSSPVFPLQQEAPLSLLRNHVTQTVSVHMCVCPSWVENSCERTCRPSLHTHIYILSTHPSPEEGNLSAVHDVTSCIQTGPCTLY